MSFFHGIQTTETTQGARPLTQPTTDVIGLVATAVDADADFFPLDTVVEVTDIDAAIGKAGVAGTLADSLIAIRSQVRPIVHVVRVADDADASVVGTTDAGGNRTGLQALADSASKFGYSPRILGAPGLDTQAVADALASMAQRLNGMAYATANGAANGDAVGYRANFGQKELLLIHPEANALKADGTQDTVSAVAFALGHRAFLDKTVGWNKSISNNVVNGILGVSRPISFDLMDMANDAGILNAADVTTIIRRDGYRFWGSRTCASDPLYAFEPTVRTGQVIRDTIANGLFWAIDKRLNAGLIKDLISTINNELSGMTARGEIIGGRCWYDPAKNSQTDLMGGKLALDYDFTPVAPLEHLDLTQTLTDTYYADLAAQLAA